MKNLMILTLLLAANLFASSTITAIEESYQRGELTQDERILNKVYSFLNPAQVDPRFRAVELEVIKCGTPILMQYEQVRPELAPATIATIESLLNPQVNALRDTYLSPGGHFFFTYSTSGAGAVPAADGDLSGIPDYVEWAGEYLDYTWEMEVDSAGFAGPNHIGGDGYYNVSFEDMGAYGYCTTSGVDGSELTRLVLNNNFIGFGSNQDPDGNVKGAMKVTCAHEFKHASQRSHSNWSESGWVELDATWAEEFVFDYVNDSMLNFMGSGDPYSHPHWGLDHGASGTGSYEDYAWEDFMHQRFDANSYTEAPIIEYFWSWRETHTAQNVMSSYSQALANAGSSFSEAFGEYVVWNFFTGSRAVMSGGESQFGYDEAGVNGYPSAALAATHNSYPVSSSVSGIENLACKMIRLNTTGEVGLEISFDGQDAVEMYAMWAIRQDNNTVDWGSIELDDNNDGSVVLDVRNASMAALIPVVTQLTGSTYSASYTVEQDALAECDPGDMNDDGFLDVSDLVRLVAVILGNGEPPTPVELCAGDVNDDDQTSVQDVVALVDLILG